MPGLAELELLVDGAVVTAGSVLRALMPFLVAFALLLGPAMACLVAYWARSLAQALRERRSFMIVPTSRTEKMEPRTYNTIVRSISQVRLRRRNAIMQPAGAVRVSLSNANKLAVVHAMGGPPWMAGVLDVNNVTGVVVAPVDLIDPAMISPKSILPPVWVDLDADAPTVPIAGSRPAPPPRAAAPEPPRDAGGDAARGLGLGSLDRARREAM
jgi:hypothetical protein